MFRGYSVSPASGSLFSHAHGLGPTAGPRGSLLRPPLLWDSAWLVLGAVVSDRADSCLLTLVSHRALSLPAPVPEAPPGPEWVELPSLPCPAQVPQACVARCLPPGKLPSPVFVQLSFKE